MTGARIAVLASGGGSNLQAILDYLEALGDARGGDVIVVASNRPDAGALGRAARAGVATAVLRSPHAPDGEAVEDVLARHDVGLVALAGYMRLVPPAVTHAYRGRMLNVHPALLPAFGGKGMYGPRVHEAVLASGVQETGVTVHLVDEVYDRGAILAHGFLAVHELQCPRGLRDHAGGDRPAARHGRRGGNGER